MRSFKHWLVAAGIFCVLSAPARASLDALVSSPTAVIYDLAGGKLQPIVTLYQGQVLKVANQAKGAWYRCVVPDSNPPRAGWIAARDISVSGASQSPSASASSPRRSSRPTPENQRSSFSLLGKMTAPTPSHLQISAGLAPQLTFGFMATLQYLYPLSSAFAIGARADVLYAGGRLDPTAGSGALAYSGIAIPISAIAELTFFNRPTFAAGLIAGAGISPFTSISVTNATGSSSASLMSLAVPACIQVRAPFGPNLLLSIEAGYELLLSLSNPSTGAIGGDLSAPMAGLGVGIKL